MARLTTFITLQIISSTTATTTPATTTAASSRTPGHLNTPPILTIQCTNSIYSIPTIIKLNEGIAWGLSCNPDTAEDPKNTKFILQLTFSGPRIQIANIHTRHGLEKFKSLNIRSSSDQAFENARKTVAEKNPETALTEFQIPAQIRWN